MHYLDMNLLVSTSGQDRKRRVLHGLCVAEPGNDHSTSSRVAWAPIRNTDLCGGHGDATGSTGDPAGAATLLCFPLTRKTPPFLSTRRGFGGQIHPLASTPLVPGSLEIQRPRPPAVYAPHAPFSSLAPFRLKKQALLQTQAPCLPPLAPASLPPRPGSLMAELPPSLHTLSSPHSCPATRCHLQGCGDALTVRALSAARGSCTRLPGLRDRLLALAPASRVPAPRVFPPRSMFRRPTCLLGIATWTF